MNQLRRLVTDHAVIRYMERVLGIDVDQVRQEILTHQVMATIGCQDADCQRAEHVPLQGGPASAVVKEAKVVTIVCRS
jgi:hypothetical protein